MAKPFFIYNIKTGMVRDIDSHMLTEGDICTYEDGYCIWMYNKDVASHEENLEYYEGMDLYKELLAGKTIGSIYQTKDAFHYIADRAFDSNIKLPDSTTICNAIDIFRVIINHVDDIRFLAKMKCTCSLLRREVCNVYKLMTNAILVSRSSKSYLENKYENLEIVRILRNDMFFNVSECSLDEDNVKIYKYEDGYIIYRNKAFIEMLRLSMSITHSKWNVHNIVSAIKKYKRNALRLRYTNELYFVVDYHKIGRSVYTDELSYDDIIPNVYRGNILFVNHVPDIGTWISTLRESVSPLNTYFLFDTIEEFTRAFQHSNMSTVGSLPWIRELLASSTREGRSTIIQYRIDIASILFAIQNGMSTHSPPADHLSQVGLLSYSDRY